jgi:hypothetical protein
VLTVTDPALFRQTFTTGIGSAKAFGFGLLALAPASKRSPSLQQQIILCMTANPNPLHTAVLQLPGYGAIVIPHAHRKPVAATCKPLVIQRVMLGILQPQPVVLLCEFLNCLWQRV